MINDDFVWVAVSSALTGRKKRVATGFINFDCPMCVHRGHNADRRGRCGIKNNSPGVGVHCFNCGFDTKWVPGDPLSHNLRDFMIALGVEETEVKRLNHRAMIYRKMVESNPEIQHMVSASFSLDFPRKALPNGAKSFSVLAQEGCSDPDFLDVATYLLGRGDEIAKNEFYWSPSTLNNMNRRVIIPYYRKNEIVGWTSRLIDKPQLADPNDPLSPLEPKYFQTRPPDFIFNNHLMEIPERKYIMVMEGPMDALAIDGCAVLSANISDRQAAWIDSMGKTVIVIPDHDKSGQRLVDIALKRKWHVAFPLLNDGSSMNWWEPDIKDVAASVARYGRLYTLASIMNTATNTPFEIAIKRKMML